MKQKSGNVALILSFLLPGAGLWYLGRWKDGFINLGAVFIVAFILALVLPDKTFSKIQRGITFGLASGSGALAMNMAQQMNAKNEEQESAGNSIQAEPNEISEE